MNVRADNIVMPITRSEQSILGGLYANAYMTFGGRSPKDSRVNVATY
jgi:hypothetical protein